jgi:hypothetical protein
LVQAESSPFSPVTFNEFKDLTAKWRRAAGREVVDMPADIKDLADQLVDATRQVELLQQQLEEETAKLIQLEEIPADKEKRRKEVEVAKNRAIAEMDRIRGAYERRLAEFRQTGR